MTSCFPFLRSCKGPGKRGHIVADTLLPMMFLGLRKMGNICCGHKMFLNKIRNIFCPGHKICVRNKCCARGQTGKHLCRQQCVLVCQGLKLLLFSPLKVKYALDLFTIIDLKMKFHIRIDIVVLYSIVGSFLTLRSVRHLQPCTSLDEKFQRVRSPI